MDPFIGQIQAFGFNFPPRGWAQCDGQLLAISQNTALFSLLGTTFGGDGRTTFGLPDLRGRSMVHFGNGPGLGSVTWGQKAGNENTTLITQNIPAHNHGIAIPVSTDVGGENSPAGQHIANHPSAFNEEATPGQTLPITQSSVGNNQQFSNRPPYLGINICIALVGVYPSRN